MRFVDVEAHAHEMQVGSQTCKSSACALGGRTALLSLSAQFETDLWEAAKGRARFFERRTGGSVPISSSGDAAVSSWSVSQTDPSATLDRVSSPRNNVGWQHVRVPRFNKPARAILKPNNNDSDAAAPGPATR